MERGREGEREGRIVGAGARQTEQREAERTLQLEPKLQRVGAFAGDRGGRVAGDGGGGLWRAERDAREADSSARALGGGAGRAALDD